MICQLKMLAANEIPIYESPGDVAIVWKGSRFRIYDQRVPVVRLPERVLAGLTACFEEAGVDRVDLRILRGTKESVYQADWLMAIAPALDGREGVERLNRVYVPTDLVLWSAASTPQEVMMDLATQLQAKVATLRLLAEREGCGRIVLNVSESVRRTKVGFWELKIGLAAFPEPGVVKDERFPFEETAMLPSLGEQEPEGTRPLLQDRHAEAAARIMIALFSQETA